MRDFMVTLLICSATMSAVAVLYMAFTPLLAKRYSEKWRYYAWIVIVTGLIVPFRPNFGNAIVNLEIQGGASLQTVAESENIMVADIITASVSNPAENTMLSDFIEDSSEIDMPSKQVLNPVEDTAPYVGSPSKVIDWWLVISAIWLTGMIGLPAYHIIKYYRFNKTARRWSKTVTDRQTLELLRNLKTEMGISKTVVLQVCPLIGSPMLIGLFRPLILLPKVDLSKDEQYFILKHELVHYKRKDILYKCFTLIAEAVHWFNPIVHLTAKAINAGCELSCDAAVVNGTDAKIRQHYSETIIGIARYRSKINTILSTNFYGGKKGMKNRILSIADKSKKRKGIIVICFALILTICTSLVIAANAPSTENPALDLPESKNVNTDKNLSVNSAMTAAQSPSVTDVLFASRFDKYKDYGITYDVMTDSLYYNGELVRYFEDFHILDDDGNVVAGTNYSSENGKVDVHGVRDLSQIVLNDDGSYSSGVLIGVEPDSQAEFDARTIAWQKDFQSTAIHEENDMDYTPDELSRQNKTLPQIFSEYEEYGITFDENSINGGLGNVYFKGQLVKLFIDDNPFSGVFQFSSSDGGEITVRTIYDVHGDLVNVEIELKWADTEKMFKDSYSIYEQYGLTRNIETGRLYYNGELVRYFEDYQVMGGNVSSYEDGDVDVRAVRDSAGDLIGVIPYSQADFDARTSAAQ